METNFNFNSQICTSRSQSECLLALGLKPETADMSSDGWNDPVVSWGMEWSKEIIESGRLPAWSLHRLIEMMPNEIRNDDAIASLIVSNVKVQYYLHDVEYSKYLKSAGLWKEGNTYDNIIDCIEWLIKEGYFNKKYLEV